MTRSVTVAAARRTIGFVVLHLRFWKKEERWYGECLELGTSTFAGTLERTQEELAELAALHLNALEGAGERTRFFREHRIRLYRAGEHVTAIDANLPVADPGIGPLEAALRLPVSA